MSTAVFVALSATLTGTSVVYSPLWFLSFIGLVPFLYLLFFRNESISLRSTFLLGVLFGFLFHLIIYLPAWDTYPLSWAGVNGFVLPHAFIGFTWVLYSSIVALPWGLFALLGAQSARKWRDPLFLILWTALLFTLAQWGSALLFSVVSWGSSVPLSFDFTAGAIGYALAHSPFDVPLLLARVGGIALLSGGVVVVNATLTRLAAAYFRERRALLSEGMATFFALSLVLVLITIAFIDARRDQGSDPAWARAGGLRVVIVATDFPSTLTISEAERRERSQAVEDALSRIAEEGFAPDLTVFPEGTRIREYSSDYKELLSLYLPKDSLVFDSGYHETFGGAKVLEARAYRVGGDVEGKIGKQFPVAFGEYLPYFFELGGKLFLPGIVEDLVSYRVYETDTRMELAQTKGVLVGARLCSEIFSPRLYRKLREGGAGLLMDLSSVAMFHSSPNLIAQVRASARVRAVENGLPMIVALNGGSPSVYDCVGKEILPENVERNLFFFTFSVSTICQR